MKQLFYVLLLSILGIHSAFALSLDEAKAQGLVGERNDGYLGYVVPPAGNEVKELVKSVNNKRKEKFEETAAKHNLQVKQVALRFYQRAISETQTGHYYQDTSGRWVKK